jgi:hypothetical protein
MFKATHIKRSFKIGISDETIEDIIARHSKQHTESLRTDSSENQRIAVASSEHSATR